MKGEVVLGGAWVPAEIPPGTGRTRRQAAAKPPGTVVAGAW